MILAVDGGASKTVALVYDETKMELIGLGIAGPTNLTSVPREEIVFKVLLNSLGVNNKPSFIYIV
jgi:N-acetylglucosamine kinase